MISPQAIIDPSARIADDVEIGPWTVVGKDVEIGSGTWIGPHAVIKGPTKIGKNNRIFQYASVGDDPQHLVFDPNEKSELIIGDNNTIREYCSVNRGTEAGGGVTKIGNDNLLMAYVHVAHDCNIGNNVIFINNAVIAGHVCVRDYARIGAFVAVHQFCTVGSHSFLSHAALISKDVLPYVIVVGHDPRVNGINSIGLKRFGMTAEVISELKKAYRIIFRQGKQIGDVLDELQPIAAECPEVQLFIDSINSSERGVLR